MGRSKEREFSFQRTFFPGAEGFEDSPFDEVRSLVAPYRLYCQRPNGPIHLIRVSERGLEDVNQTVDSESWLPVELPERKRGTGLAGLVIIFEGAVDPERRRQLVSDSSRSVSKKRGVVIVIEKGVSGLSEEEKNSRAAILKEQGFNQPTISERKIGETRGSILRARRPRSRRRRAPIDITETRARFGLKRGLRRTEEELASQGILTVSNSEANELLRNSGNVPRDARRIADGGGREFETLACGCRLRQTIDGSWLVEPCNTDSCVLEQVASKTDQIDPLKVVAFEKIQGSDHFINPQVNRAEVGEIITKRKGGPSLEYIVVIAQLPELDSHSRRVGWKKGKVAIRR